LRERRGEPTAGGAPPSGVVAFSLVTHHVPCVLRGVGSWEAGRRNPDRSAWAGLCGDLGWAGGCLLVVARVRWTQRRARDSAWRDTCVRVRAVALLHLLSVLLVAAVLADRPLVALPSTTVLGPKGRSVLGTTVCAFRLRPCPYLDYEIPHARQQTGREEALHQPVGSALAVRTTHPIACGPDQRSAPRRPRTPRIPKSHQPAPAGHADAPRPRARQVTAQPSGLSTDGRAGSCRQRAWAGVYGGEQQGERQGGSVAEQGTVGQHLLLPFSPLFRLALLCVLASRGIPPRTCPTRALRPRLADLLHHVQSIVRLNSRPAVSNPWMSSRGVIRYSAGP